MPGPSVPKQGSSRLVRWGLLAIGALSLALGVVGAVLPLLPTVPFLLVTAACWSKASPRGHRWLLAQPRLGPLIERWERERSLPRRARWAAVSLIVLSVAGSVWLTRDHAWLPWALAAVAVLAAVGVLRLPVENRDRAGL